MIKPHHPSVAWMFPEGRKMCVLVQDASDDPVCYEQVVMTEYNPLSVPPSQQ